MINSESNAGAEFSAGKFREAVPRPNASGGERLSRGRLPLPAHFQRLCGGGILLARYILSKLFLFDQHPIGVTEEQNDGRNFFRNE
jgi:hypothetical protein